MKVLLYFEGMNYIAKSGIGRALQHQMRALDLVGIPYTLNPRDSYDIAHINTYGPYSWRVANQAAKAGKGVVYHAHSTEEDTRNSFLLSNQAAPLLGKWLRKCYNMGDRVVTPTPYSKKLLEHSGVERPISVVSNGIDLDFFHQEPGARDRFRSQFGFSEKDKVIMSIGLYIERKGVLDFVALADRMPQYQFIWLGYTSPWLIPERVREAVRTERHNLHFPGYVERETVRDAFCGADLFFFPTWEETEGIVLLEAFAMECEVVVRDIPIYEGWIKDGVHAWKEKEMEGFERLIRCHFEDRLPKLGAQAHRLAEERDLLQIGRQLSAIYEEVLARTSKPMLHSNR